MASLTRRDAVKRIAGVGAGLAFADGIIRGQSSELTVGGKRVEFVVSVISDATIRITAVPLGEGRVPADDSLVQAAAGQVVMRRPVAEAQTIRAAHLSIRFTSAG
jgi:hypothetical protein